MTNQEQKQVDMYGMTEKELIKMIDSRRTYESLIDLATSILSDSQVQMMSNVDDTRVSINIAKYIINI